ncbi:MAG: 50S ribosomal protein L35 [Candidatus Tritonobacter lacicola]|nr:50S ribosomal protein L35 [Candidatus Tritonobacter lacicola]
MPKMKTSRMTAKRFKVTGRKKVMGRHAGASHIMTKKNRKRKRNLRKGKMISAADTKRILIKLPYGN